MGAYYLSIVVFFKAKRTLSTSPPQLASLTSDSFNQQGSMDLVWSVSLLQESCPQLQK